jgi:hypothetical protein
MDCYQPPHHGSVIDGHVPGERPVIGKDTVIPHFTVMGDMRIGHKQVVVTDYRLAAFTGPDVKSAVFPDDIIVPDLQEAFLSFIFQVLRLASDYRSAKNLTVISDNGIPFDQAMAADLATPADTDKITHNTECPDFYIAGKLGFFRYDSCRMNIHIR